MSAALRSDETRFPFLARLGREGRAELAALPTTRATANRTVLRRGEPANGAYLVLAGALRIYYITAEGRDATLYRVEPGGTCVLALAATFNDAPYPAWVDTGPSGVELVRVSSDVFARLLCAEEAFRSFVFASLTGRLFELMERLEEVRTTSVEQRVARYLERSQAADGTVRATQTGIASELGTAREVVFRALHHLVEARVIETGRGRVRVLDRPRLAALASGASP